MDETITNPPAPAILLGKQHDLSAFCDHGGMRVMFEGVHYDPAKQRVEATDGRILIRVPVEVTHNYPVEGDAKLPRECVIHSGWLKRALGAFKKSKFDILNRLRLSAPPDSDKVTLSHIGDGQERSSATNESIEGKYPDTERALTLKAGEVAKPETTIYLQAQLLYVIADYARKHGKDDKKTGVALTFTDHLGLVKFKIPLKDNNAAAEGAIMPMLHS